VTLAQGLINVGVDTFNSFVQLGIDQLHFWLPPLPPLPPLPGSAQVFAQTASSTVAQQRPTPDTGLGTVTLRPSDPTAPALIPKTTPASKRPKSSHANDEVNKTPDVASPTTNTRDRAKQNDTRSDGNPHFGPKNAQNAKKR
jgi:hypothetical protein